MVGKIKPKTLDEKYITAVEEFYNTPDHDLGLMIRASRRVASEQESKERKAGQVVRISRKSRMTEAEVIKSLAESSGLRKTDVKEVFDALATLATEEIRKNRKFTLPGFGKLVKETARAREGRNPATGKAMKIPARTRVRFGIDKGLKIK